MAKYTKSHSNYVISEMRQFSNSGTIYERDITTIGGRDSFSRGQIPVYRSGNFVITINGEDSKTAKVGSTNIWVNNNGSDSNIWTLETMGKEESAQDLEPVSEVVKPNEDPYNLSDFAYYGSCRELFRASVNDIIRKFPGEFYIPYREVTEYVRTYESKTKVPLDLNGRILKELPMVTRGGRKSATRYTYLDNKEYKGKIEDIQIKTLVGKDTFTSLEAIEKEIGIEKETVKESIRTKSPFSSTSRVASAINVVYEGIWTSGTSYVGNIVYYNTGTDNPQPLGLIKSESGDTQLYALSNPLGLNVVYDNITDDDNPLRYLLTDQTYKNYEIIDERGFAYDIDVQFLLGGTFKSGETAETDFTVYDRLSGNTHSIASHQTFDGNFSVYEQLYSGAPAMVTPETEHQFDPIGPAPIDAPIVGPRSVSSSSDETQTLTVGAEGTRDSSISTNIGSSRYSFSTFGTDINQKGKKNVHQYDVLSSRTTFEYDEEILTNACPGQKIGEIRLIMTRHLDIFDIEQTGNNMDPNSGTSLSGYVNVKKSESVTTYRSPDDQYNYGSSASTEWSFALIYVYLGDNDEFYYLANYDDLHEKGLLGAHIRPKPEFFESFYNNLDTFEQLLLNPYTDPIYKSTFNIVEEDDYGDYSHLESFVFPNDGGEYNIATAGIAYENFIQRLAEIGDYYDIRYSDVIWRAMTHEAIKNLDWTLTKRDESDEYDTHAVAYGKIDKTVRTMGRFFDNLMNYTDNLKTTNTITYDKDNNLSDELITKKLNECGWDVVQITPFRLTEYQQTTTSGNVPFDWYGLNYHDLITFESNNKVDDSPIFRKFYRDNTTSGVYPYYVISSTTGTDDWKYKYAEVPCESGVKWTSIGRDYVKTSASRFVLRAVKKYNVSKKYTYPEINNEFMRRLTINTRNIVNKKGTVEGIEAILAMFGMRSKRFAESLTNVGYSDASDEYDYCVKEYVTRVNSCLIDDIKTGDDDYYYDTINHYKDISYDTPQFRNGINLPYQGLPLNYYEDTEQQIRFLYPYFDGSETYDGNPYYQMFGGWQQRLPYTYDVDNNIVAKDVVGDAFAETVKDVVSVPTIKDLINIPYYNLSDNDVVMVDDTSGVYAVVDGIIYDLYEETVENKKYTYFTVTVDNSSVTVGQTIFDDTITVSDPFSVGGTKRYSLVNSNLDGNVIRIYVGTTSDGPVIKAYSNLTSVSRVSVFNGEERANEGYTNYFVIRDSYYAGEFSDYGWNQLKYTDHEYFVINNLRNENDGNNPHTGRLNYDNGTSYVTQFSKLFRYTIDNDLFNERLYEKYGESADSIVDEFGFDLYVDSANTCSDCYGEYSLVEGNGINDSSKWKIAIECDRLIKSGDTYSSVTAMHDTYTSGNTSGYTDALIGEKVINTKCFDIDFNIYVSSIDDIENSRGDDKIPKEAYLYTNEAQTQVKYIEEVILPYLNQMIPSTCICRINYKQKVIKNE